MTHLSLKPREPKILMLRKETWSQNPEARTSLKQLGTSCSRGYNWKQMVRTSDWIPSVPQCGLRGNLFLPEGGKLEEFKRQSIQGG